MVIIHTKKLERKKAVDDATPRGSLLEPCGLPAVSQATALFSLRSMDSGMWVDSGCLFAAQRSPVGASVEILWDALPEAEMAGCVTSLLRDLHLSEAMGTLTAPPSKRQCRSLSCSEEPGVGLGRGAWRPQGSRVWTAVEKRRCHSGSSAQRCPAVPAGGFPAMQRSSSFSLPAHANRLPELPVFSFASKPASPSWPPSPAEHPRPLFLSQEHISPRGMRGASPDSSPDSTPDLGRRAGAGTGGLPRSRSQPCALDERKVGVKRRRPQEGQEPRPSLDLAKMTQRRTFHSLSCPGFTEVECCFSSPAPSSEHATHCAAPCSRRPGVHHGRRDGSCGDELNGDPAGGEELETDDWANGGGGCWQGPCSSISDADRLGGELDIEQIERN